MRNLSGSTSPGSILVTSKGSSKSSGGRRDLFDNRDTGLASRNERPLTTIQKYDLKKKKGKRTLRVDEQHVQTSVKSEDRLTFRGIDVTVNVRNLVNVDIHW